jgi:hypothetical protein
MEEMRMHAKFWLESLKVRDHSEDLSVDWKIILKRILGKYDLKMFTGLIWLKIGASGGL